MSMKLTDSANPASNHATLLPSAWVQRFAGLIAPGARVLDLACGHGRHSRWLADQGYQVEAVDRDADALASLVGIERITPRCADLEDGPWPYYTQGFDGIVVSRYLWRPLLQTLADSVAPGGLLIYETFASGNATVGRPTNPDFLLQPGELLARFADWRVVGFEDGFLPQPERFVQRLCAARPGGPVAALPRRYPLSLESGLTPTL